jgi:uncharacterized protein YqhQ
MLSQEEQFRKTVTELRVAIAAVIGIILAVPVLLVIQTVIQEFLTNTSKEK